MLRRGDGLVSSIRVIQTGLAAPIVGQAFMIRTKIVATLGPASADVATLLGLFEAGVDVCRLNFSHGDLKQALTLLKNVQAAIEQFGRPIAVLGDLCGPKIRLGKVRDIDGTSGMPIDMGDTLVVQRATIEGNMDGAVRRVSCTYPQLIDDVKVGDRLLVE